MRALLGFSLFALMAAGAAGVGARAETYPTRQVTFVVPFAPGGGTEFLARLLGQRLEQRLGKPQLSRPFSVNSPASSTPWCGRADPDMSQVATNVRKRSQWLTTGSGKSVRHGCDKSAVAEVRRSQWPETKCLIARHYDLMTF